MIVQFAGNVIPQKTEMLTEQQDYAISVTESMRASIFTNLAVEI
jgi:hypothetical protein